MSVILFVIEREDGCPAAETSSYSTCRDGAGQIRVYMIYVFKLIRSLGVTLQYNTLEEFAEFNYSTRSLLWCLLKFIVRFISSLQQLVAL